MNSLLSEWRTHTGSVIQKSQAQVQHHLDESVHGLLTKYDTNVQRQFGHQQQQIGSNTHDIAKLEARITELQNENQQIWSNVNRCLRICEVAGSQQNATNVDREQQWDADPNLTIARANFKDIFTREAFLLAIQGWMERMGY